jgi:hypothetical protein
MLGEPECVAYKVLAELDVVDPAGVRLLDLLSGSAYAKASAPIADASLRDELLRRRDVDQAARESLRRMVPPGARRDELSQEALATVEAMQAVDADNTAWLKTLVRARGWPGQSMVGAAAADAAWLMAQHADRDPEFQRECLGLLEAAVRQGEASPRNLAYLTDRVLVHEGRTQRYGTQFMHGHDGLVPQPIEDPEGVDELRASVGLEPLSSYEEQMKRMYEGEGRAGG